MIRIRDLDMTYRSKTTEHHAVRGLSLEVERGQFYTLLGPSGCGKTTTLRCVAGLEEPDFGEIQVGDALVYSSKAGVWTDPFNRDIGMVFQSYAIWPHMTVFDNVAFPLRQLKPVPPRREVQDRVMRVLSMVKLDGFAERPAPFLSGGQQQRLALPAPSSASRRCCCWTSRSAISTPSCAARCASRSRTCSVRSASPASMSRMTRWRR